MNTPDRARDHECPVVFLHGWGHGPAVWNDVIAQIGTRRAAHAPDLAAFSCRSPDALVTLAADLARHAPPRCVAAGWSLGGQVALQWALAAPRQVVALVLVGTSPCFVERAGWPCGMARSVFEDFSRAVETDGAGALRRFAQLCARHDDDARAVARKLRRVASDQPASRAQALAAGLAILREADLRPRLADIGQPALVLHGERDALVPMAAASRLARGLPRATLAAVDGAGHAPLLSRARHLTETVLAFLDHERVDAR